MLRFTLGKAAALTAVTVVVLSAAPAEAAWSKGEAKCRATISKSLGKYVSTAQKAIGGCHKGRDNGKVSASKNCNDISAADTKNKVPKAANKLRSSVGGGKTKCADKDGTPFANVLANFERCPSPANEIDDGGATDGIDSFAELADCLIALADAQVEQSASDILGLPGVSGLSKDQLKCHGTLPKAYMKYVDTVAKERGKAQASADKGGGSAVWDQANYDGKGKIGKAMAKLNSSIDKGCTGKKVPLSKANLDALGSCGDTPAQLKDCVAGITDKQARGLVSLQFKLAPRCASKVQIRSFAAVGEQLTNTGLDTGWTGLGHNVDTVDGFTAQAAFTGCDADCRNCGLAIAPDKDVAWANCRCADDYTKTCDTINDTDADDCGAGGHCNCYFGPPLPLSAGGAPVCVMASITEDIDGVVDQGTATAETAVNIAAIVRLGIRQSQPCPICSGDGAANDGNSEGTCVGGLRDDQTCDRHANHPTFGPVSYHCPPQGANISGSGLKIGFTITGGEVSLPFNTTCDQPFQSENCACAVCTGDTTVACNSDAECAEAGGTCSSNGGGANRWPNACSDGLCTNGACEAGPMDTFCDGLIRANGKGILACGTDADCDAMASECDGGNCGACTLSSSRSCFNDPITATGATSQNGGDVVAAFCVPPSASVAVNSASGSPGPSRLKVSMEFEGLCDDGTVAEPPAASNCSLAPPERSWRWVHSLITSNYGCATSGCHGNGSASGGLGNFEDEALSYAALLGVASTQNTAMALVEPGNPESSYLWLKLSGLGSGAQMPLDPATGNPVNMSASALADVYNWIAEGAGLNN